MIRRAVDITVSAASLIVLAPLMALTGLAVRLDSPGPVFYRATRMGLDGRNFQMLKFRTMTDAAVAGRQPITGPDDPRVTRTGRLLRPARIDELPQLINVLAGEMSLIGPRPEDPEFAGCYSEDQRRVLGIRPGITGLSQLAFAGEASLLDDDDPRGSYIRKVLPRKLALDLYYLQKRGILLDIEICLRTLAMPFRNGLAAAVNDHEQDNSKERRQPARN